jgi:hypothetical protein
MSAATTSSTDWIEVHVRLLDEAVDVWRPVRARALSEHVFHLSSDPVPDDEHWAFQPGEEVVVEHRLSEGGKVLVAVARATDMDERSNLWLRKAG